MWAPTTNPPPPTSVSISLCMPRKSNSPPKPKLTASNASARSQKPTSLTDSSAPSQVQNKTQLLALLRQLINALSQENLPVEEISTAETTLDWVIDNIPKGISWIIENIGPLIPPLLAMI